MLESNPLDLTSQSRCVLACKDERQQEARREA